MIYTLYLTAAFASGDNDADSLVELLLTYKVFICVPASGVALMILWHGVKEDLYLPVMPNAGTRQ